MTFWQFILCMYCILSSGDLSRFVVANQLHHLPISGAVRGTFFALTWPAMIGTIGLPVYAFIAMPWWQPIVGIVVAAVLGNIITRRMLAGSSWLYMWAIGFSLAGLAFFVYFMSSSH